jgi:multidrug efflux pump subunit AcrA (membrane-fusion protein)
MNQLVATVIGGGEPLWYPADGTELPPQIEQALQQHVDQSHARMVGVIPIGTLDSQNESHGGAHRCPIGAVVVERFEDGSVSGDLRRQTSQIARHAGIALNNCLTHRRASALPLAKALASLRTVVGRSAPAKTSAAVSVVLAIAIALACVPATLRIGARGTLRPCEWRNVFAGIDGTVEEIAVQHGQMVRKDQVLARMHSAELEMEIAALVGQKQTISEQLLALQRTLLERGRVSAEQRSRLTADLEQLEQRLIGVESQLNVERKRRESLVVRSPIAGRVVTWDVEKALAARPVRRGDGLITVVDPTSDWELELRIDERDVGHIVSAAGSNATDADLNGAATLARELPVTFCLRTCPGRKFRGRIVQLDRTSREDESGQNVVVARAQIDAAQLPELPSGATVRARIDCGTRSIGYVWFRDLIDVIGTEVLFWL